MKVYILSKWPELIGTYQLGVKIYTVFYIVSERTEHYYLPAWWCSGYNLMVAVLVDK